MPLPFNAKKLFGLFMAGLFLLSACTIRTHSPLSFKPQAPTIEEKNGITYILLPIEIEDKGSRTLRIHLRENILDLTANDQHFRLRGKKSYRFMLKNASKSAGLLYPPSWQSKWTDHYISHQDWVVPAISKRVVPLLFVLPGPPPSPRKLILHLSYSYPQTATYDELRLIVPLPGGAQPSNHYSSSGD
ncbi:MAG: hypothetical protein ACP5OS_02000 [Leptospirillia bacterium]